MNATKTTDTKTTIDRFTELMCSLRRVTNTLHVQADQAIPHDLTGRQLMALKYVVDEPGLSGAQMAERLRSTPSATSQLLRRLEDKGFLSRSHTNDDRRTVSYNLGPRGRELAERAHLFQEKIAQVLVQTLEPQEREQFEHIVSKMLARMREAQARL